jgi:hypothetical protein
MSIRITEAALDMMRLPRMFMTSWVAAPRRNGQPQISYGHDLTRELNAIGFNFDRKAVDEGVSGRAGEWPHKTRRPGEN